MVEKIPFQDVARRNAVGVQAYLGVGRHGSIVGSDFLGAVEELNGEAPGIAKVGFQAQI